MYLTREFSRAALRGTLAILAAGPIASCGGGGSGGAVGGGGGGAVSTAPKFTSGASVSVAENTAATFYTATATDPQNDAVTIALYSGADADKFVLDGSGALRFNMPPNFDLPVDANGDNVYEVTLRATAGGETVDLPLRVTVTNDREGVVVRRVASGISNPVGMAFVSNKSLFKIAEKGGRVLSFDPGSKAVTEDTYVRDHKSPGEILAISWGFRDNGFQEGTYILTHDPGSGLAIQAFNADRNALGYARLGNPWTAPVQASMLQNSGAMVLAIGDPSGNAAQDASSPYGKLILLPAIDPYAGASLPTPITIRPTVVGDGIQKPGGLSPEFGRIYLADQGSSVENEISFFDLNTRGHDFGWPFYEGSVALRSNPPAVVDGPAITYGFGTGRKQGTGVVAGIINDYRFFASLGNTYVFADKNGSIWSIPYAKLIDNIRRTASDIEDRTLDFAPDQGKIDSPVAIVQGDASDRFYILDADGELFEVTPT